MMQEETEATSTESASKQHQNDVSSYSPARKDTAPLDESAMLIEEDEGQEAQWIEVEGGGIINNSSSGGNSKVMTRNVDSSNKKKKGRGLSSMLLLFRRSQNKNDNKNAKDDNNTKLSSSSNHRVVLLPPPTHPNERRRQEATKKAQCARRLLEAALLEETVPPPASFAGSTKEEMIQAAFQYATEARSCLVDNTNHLEPIIVESVHRGEAAATTCFLLRSARSWASLTGKDIHADEEQSFVDVSEEYSKQAMTHLETILASVEEADKAIGGRGVEAADGTTTLVSSLGFDNTFQDDEVQPVGSLTSLNEVLDGSAGRVTDDHNNNNNNNNKKARSPIKQDKKKPKTKASVTKNKEKKRRFSLFRRKKSVKETIECTQKTDATPQASPEKPKEEDRPVAIQYFSATLAREKQDDESEESVDNNKDTASVKASEELDTALQSAMRKEHPPSTTVRPWIGVLDGDRSSSFKPSFISAPKLDARILTAESWTSLASGRSLEEILPAASKQGQETIDDGVTWSIVPQGEKKEDREEEKKGVKEVELKTEVPQKKKSGGRKLRLFGWKRRSEKSSVEPSTTEVDSPASPPKKSLSKLYADPLEEDDGSISVSLRSDKDEDSVAESANHHPPALTLTDGSSFDRRPEYGDRYMTPDSRSTPSSGATPVSRDYSQVSSGSPSSLASISISNLHEQREIKDVVESGCVEIGVDEHAEQTKATPVNPEHVLQTLATEVEASSAAQKKAISLEKNGDLAEASQFVVEQQPNKARQSRSLFGRPSGRKSMKKNKGSKSTRIVL